MQLLRAIYVVAWYRESIAWQHRASFRQRREGRHNPLTNKVLMGACKNRAAWKETHAPAPAYPQLLVCNRKKTVLMSTD